MNLRQTTDFWCSQYIRLRDAISWNKQHDVDIAEIQPKLLVVKCCSCDFIADWPHMEAGHYFGRSSGGQSGVFYDERNLNAQCHTCNVTNAGNIPAYTEFMKEKYGEEVIEELRLKNKLIQDMGSLTLKSIADMYKSMFEGLLELF